MKDIYGGDYHASVIYITDEFIKKNPNTVQAVVNAMVRANRWIAKATPQEIVDLMPDGYKAANPSLYKEALLKNMIGYSEDGQMSMKAAGKRLQGPRAVRALGEGRGEDGPHADVRQHLREEGRRQVQVTWQPPSRSNRSPAPSPGAGGASSYTAVKDVSLSIAEGEFVSVVGPHGLRQVDAAQRRRGPPEALLGDAAHLRRAARGHQSARRLHVPGGSADALARHARKRDGGTAISRHG
jgi:hypothetical protein